MIGQRITGEDGKPLDQYSKLSPSQYQPSEEIKRLFARVQTDYQVSYTLQHRPFDEFDGISLVERTRLDQQTFGAFVGAEYIPKQKQWRWRGRKNTARNKLISILAHLLAAMLFPFVSAFNERDEEDKLTAQVMRILVENHLRKAGYEMKFLFMVLSALVNPAVLVGLEYVVAFQRVKQKLAGGKIKIIQAVDELLTGINLNIIPIDELMPADFYTNDIQRQPYMIRVRRISWDESRKIYAGKYKDEKGNDLFGYVQAGMTRIVMTGQENQTLFDIEWTEADRDYVQEITAYYRDEDLQVTFVGGVFMGSMTDPYNTNPFEHRRMSLYGEDWISIPIYPFAKTGFEPIDPTGRFFYYKSGAFKEFWDDKSLNQAHAWLQDGTALDVIKPIFINGIGQVNSTIMVPGAVIGMPAGANMNSYSSSPNLAAAAKLLMQQDDDMSASTADKVSGGQEVANVTATATAQAQQQARIILSVFGTMIADLVRQIGELTMDCIIQHTTVGEIDATIPEALQMKYKTILAKGKDKGQNVTHRINFTSKNMGKSMTKDDVRAYEWNLYSKNGDKTDQRTYDVDPYKFARTKYSMWVNPDQIVDKSMGNERQQKLLAFNMLSDPRVAPFTDQEAVVDDFIIDEFADGDPERYKRKSSPQAVPTEPNAMLSSMMGSGTGAPPPVGPNGTPYALPVGQPQ